MDFEPENEFIGDPRATGQLLIERDLLSEYSEQKLRRDRARSLWTRIVAGVLVLAAIIEPIAFRSGFIVAALAGMTAIGVAVGICLGYSYCIYTLGSNFGEWAYGRGRLQPSPLHVISILIFAGLAAMPIAGFIIRDEVYDARFWIPWGLMAWNNATAALLGYGGQFWSRPKLR